MTLLDHDYRADLKLAVSEERKARLPEREARLSLVPPPTKRSDYGKTKRQRLTDLPPHVAAKEASKHPSFGRVVASICPFSGLSRAELEQHVAGILAMVDEADRRKGRAA